MKTPEELDQMLRFRKQHLNPMMSVSYSPNFIYVQKSEGQYFVDNEGNRLLDCINNVSHIGHCNQYFIEKVTKQFGVLNTNSRFLYDSLNLATEKLLSHFPPELCVVSWCNSGSEANDLAMQMAQVYTGNEDMVCLDGAYHGHTALTMNVSPYKWNKNFKKPKNVVIAQNHCTFRGKYHDMEDSSQLYAADLRKHLMRRSKVAGFIHESMQSCAGQVVPEKDYFSEIYKVIRERGGVCIADEVQTGMGRLGHHFWAFQYYNVLPDIVTVGKALGNGYPVSAVICKREISEAFAKRNIEYFNTFGANPVACTAALSVMEVIENDKLQENAREVGDYLKEKLKPLLRFNQVGDLRGLGLFQGIDIVKDKNSRLPDQDMAIRIRQEVRKRGVLISVDGKTTNVLKIKPPIVFNKQNVDTLIEVITTVLQMINDELTASQESLPTKTSVKENGHHQEIVSDENVESQNNR